MARKGGKKKACERYKLSGRREINKKIKQERAERKKEYFAKRKEKAKENSSIEKLFEIPRQDMGANYNSNKARHTTYARQTSVMRKLQNELNRIAAEEKAAEAEKKKAEHAKSNKRLTN